VYSCFKIPHESISHYKKKRTSAPPKQTHAFAAASMGAIHGQCEPWCDQRKIMRVHLDFTMYLVLDMQQEVLYTGKGRTYEIRKLKFLDRIEILLRSRLRCSRPQYHRLPNGSDQMYNRFGYLRYPVPPRPSSLRSSRRYPPLSPPGASSRLSRTSG
jgi:hypothetical protein